MEVLGRTITVLDGSENGSPVSPTSKGYDFFFFSGIYFLFWVGLGVLFATVEQH